MQTAEMIASIIFYFVRIEGLLSLQKDPGLVITKNIF